MERNDQKQATASYILNLYEYVEQLNHNYSQYCNNLLYLEQKIPDLENNNTSNFSEDELNKIHDLVANIRHYILQSYIHIKTICTNTSFIFVDMEKLEESHQALKKKYIPTRDEVETYVLLCNSFIMMNFMQNILTSSNDILNGVYND